MSPQKSISSIPQPVIFHGSIARKEHTLYLVFFECGNAVLFNSLQLAQRVQRRRLHLCRLIDKSVSEKHKDIIINIP